MVGEEVSGERGVLDAFFEDEAVVDGGDGDGRGAKVDYQGGGFSGGKAKGWGVCELGFEWARGGCVGYLRC